jgi:hypothetical protein
MSGKRHGGKQMTAVHMTVSATARHYQVRDSVVSRNKEWFFSLNFTIWLIIVIETTNTSTYHGNNGRFLRPVRYFLFFSLKHETPHTWPQVEHERETPKGRSWSTKACNRNSQFYVDFVSRHSNSLRAGGPGIKSRWGRNFQHLSKLALRPTKSPIQWVPGLSRG